MARPLFLDSVVFRLVVGLVLAGLILSAGLGFLQLRSSEALLQADATHRVVVSTVNLQGVIRGLLENHSDSRVREALALFTTDSHVRASRLLREGQSPIEMGDWPRDFSRNTRLWHLVVGSNNPGAGVDMENPTLLEAPFDYGGQTLVLQMLIDGPAAARQMRSRIRDGVAVEWLFLIIMTLFGLLLLRRWLAAPLAAVMDLVRAHASAQPFMQLASRGRDEFALLAEAIGGMLGRLETTADQLRRSEAAFQSLYQFAPAAMVSLDAQGVILEANRRAAELLGSASEASLVGQSALGYVQLEDRVLLRQVIDRLPLDDVSRCELRLVIGQRTLDVMVECAGVRDAAGGLSGVRLSFLDVSAAKRLQREVADKSTLLNLIVDHISDAILLVDNTGRIAAHNRQLAVLLKVRPEALPGSAYNPQEFWDELGVVEKHIFVSRLRQIDADHNRPAQERFITRNGTFLFQGIPVHDVTHQPLGRLWVVQEITSQEQNERLLEQQATQLQALRRVSRHLGDVSDVQTLMDRAGQQLLDVFKIEAVGLALRRDANGSRSRQIVNRGPAPMLLEAHRELVLAIERQVMPQILSGQDVALWPDLARAGAWAKPFEHAGLTTLAAGPIRGSSDAQGILWIARRGGERIERHHLFLIEALAPIIAARLEIAQLRERMNGLELTDLVTQLANRRHLEFEARKLTQRPGYPWAVVLLNLDYFRHLNTLLDHEAANSVLREIATLLQRDTRKSCLVARLGGSTFGVLCPGTTHAQAIALAERLRAAIATRTVPLPDGSVHHLTASFGVAASAEDGSDLSLIDLAADRVETAKRAGRDRVVAAGPGGAGTQRAVG